MATLRLQAAAAQPADDQRGPRPGIERAPADDAPALASVFMDAFPADDESMARMFPPGVGDGYHRRAWERFARWGEGGAAADDEDDVVNVDGLEAGHAGEAVVRRSVGAHECNVFVVRGGQAEKGRPNGSVQSAALVWVVGPSDGGIRPWRQRWPPAAPGMAAAEWVSFQRGMAAQHDAAMGSDAHVYIEIIMTHSSARRRGHASALLRAACAVADERRSPLYLDAQPAAMALYARHGFVARHDLVGAAGAAGGTPTCPMVRQPVPGRSLI